MSLELDTHTLFLAHVTNSFGQNPYKH